MNNSAEQLKTAVQQRIAELTTWADLNQTPIHVGEFGVGRKDNTQSERDSEVVLSYFHSMAYDLAAHGFIPTVWDDQGWLAMVRSRTGVEFPFGLMDSYFDGYQDGLTAE